MQLQVNYFSIIFFSISLTAGFIAFLLLWAKQQRDRPQLDWLTAVFLSLVGLIVIVGWSGVLLASFGIFSLTGIALVLLLAAAGLGWRLRPFPPLTFLPLTAYEIILIALLLGSGIVYFRPHEYVLGGGDAGTYTNIAAALVQTGDFVLHDEWMPVLRQHADITLRQQPAVWQTRYLQFVGWYSDDHNPARLIPQFFPLHPVLMAVGVSLGGLLGGLLASPLWGVLGLAAVYLVGRQLFDRRVGLITAVLLAVTPTHIYFARYPTTEPLTLLLVFASLLAFQQLWDKPDSHPIWGVFGGLTLGAAMLTRIDLPLVILLVFAALFIRRGQNRWSKAWTAYTLTTGVLMIHAILSALLINWPYTWNTYSSVLRLLSRSSLVVGLSLLGLAGMGLVFVGWRQGWIKPAIVSQVVQSPKMHAITAVAIILLSAYAYFLRPILEPPVTYSAWPSGNEIPLLNGQNWLRMGWYLTPLGVLLSTLGLAWIVLKKSWGRYGLFLSVGVLTTIQYIYNIFNTPYHIYAMRRYVPIVIPMLMIYAAVAITAVARARPRKYAQLAGGALTLALVGGMIYQARFVLPQQDYAGAIEQIAALNEQLAPNALIIINEPSGGGFADQIGVPLRFIYGHDVATIRETGDGLRPFLDDMMKYAAERERPLQLIAINPIDPALRQELPLQPVTMIPITLKSLKNSFFDFPSAIRKTYYGIEIYNINNANTAAATVQLPITIDIGTLDALYIQDGFYHKEPRPNEATMRWASEKAALEIPLTGPAPVTIEIRAKIFRPDAVAATPVVVFLDGRKIGQFTPQKEWQTFTIAAQANPTNGASILQFNSIPFIPADLDLNNDTRSLGFLLDWVKIEQGAPK